MAAAFELFTECGAGATSIEQVARRARVTRATVYRRFPDKTTLLARAIEWADRVDNEDHQRPEWPDWPDLDRMLDDWADYLARPRNRRMLRRLYGAVDDFPQLLEAYREAHGHRRGEAVRATLDRARAHGQLPEHGNTEVLLGLLNGAVLHHLGGYPDTSRRAEIKDYLTAVLREAGYRPGRA